MRAHRVARPDIHARINAQRLANPRDRLERIKEGALRRGISFAEEDREFFVATMLCECYYCGYEPEVRAASSNHT